jgi:hypothetical protein
MPEKPGDLLLGVIDFFGILVPGAVLAFLHGGLLLRPFALSLQDLREPTEWIPAFFVSYVLGHFLLGFSVPLNRFASRRLSRETKAYLEAVRTRLQLPAAVPDDATHFYYSAFSYVRLKSAAAVAEVERQSAEYKLFRSLTLLFLLDMPLALIAGRLTLLRLLAALAVALLSYYRFQWLLDWTYQLAFDFYLQLRSADGTKQS